MYADPTLMDLAAAYAKRRNGRKTKHAVACARPGAKAKMSAAQVVSIVKQFLAEVPSGPTRDALQKALIDYADNSAAERRMLAEGNKADARRFNHEAGRANDVAVAAWLRLGGSAKFNDLRQVLQTLGSISFSRPGAKAKMGRAEDIYRKLSSGSVTVANAKEWERLAVEALRLPDFTPAGTDWSLHELAEEIGAEVLALKSRASRPGAKAKSTHAAATPVAVTEAEYAAIAARDAVSKKILGDSQYQITEADRRVRAAGDAAYKAALARHNAWHAAWNAAATDEERAKIEAKAKAAEAGMRVYRASRPGAKAKFANDWHGKRVTNNAGKIFLVQRSAAGYDLYAMDSGKKAKSMTQDQMDEAARSGKFRDVFSRPSAKAKMAVHAGVLAQAQANVRRAEKDYAEAKERLEAMIRYDHPEARIAQAERGVELAEKRLEEAEKALRSLHSRPGAKAKSTHAALPPQTLEAERKPGGGSHSEAVSRKIATLINEGKPQDQAVAIALDLERRGEL